MTFHSIDGWEQTGELLITVGSNFAMFPVIIKAWRIGLYIDSVVGFFAMTASLAYHILQTLDAKLLGGDNGRYHVADNVFAISVFSFAILGLLQLESIVASEVLRIICLAVAIFSQCIKPWDIRYTLIPILGTLVFVIIISLCRRKRLHIRKGRFCIAISLLVLGLYTFKLGLDDANDYLRIFHGLWHLICSIFMYFTISALNPPHIVQARLQALEAYVSVYSSNTSNTIKSNSQDLHRDDDQQLTSENRMPSQHAIPTFSAMNPSMTSTSALSSSSDFLPRHRSAYSGQTNGALRNRSTNVNNVPSWGTPTAFGPTAGGVVEMTPSSASYPPMSSPYYSQNQPLPSFTTPPLPYAHPSPPQHTTTSGGYFPPSLAAAPQGKAAPSPQSDGPSTNASGESINESPDVKYLTTSCRRPSNVVTPPQQQPFTSTQSGAAPSTTTPGSSSVVSHMHYRHLQSLS